MTGEKSTNSVIIILFLLHQTHGSHPGFTWTSRIRDKSKFSEPQRQASYDFKRAQFALNVHTDATDDERGLSVLPIQAIMHYFISAAASGLFCFLYTLSLSIITEARALTLGQYKKLSCLTLRQSTTQQTASNIQSKVIIIPVRCSHAWQGKPPFMYSLQNMLGKMLSYSWGYVNQ